MARHFFVFSFETSLFERDVFVVSRKELKLNILFKEI